MACYTMGLMPGIEGGEGGNWPPSRSIEIASGMGLEEVFDAPVPLADEEAWAVYRDLQRLAGSGGPVRGKDWLMQAFPVGEEIGFVVAWPREPGEAYPVLWFTPTEEDKECFTVNYFWAATERAGWSNLSTDGVLGEQTARASEEVSLEKLLGVAGGHQFVVRPTVARWALRIDPLRIDGEECYEMFMGLGTLLAASEALLIAYHEAGHAGGVRDENKAWRRGSRGFAERARAFSGRTPQSLWGMGPDEVQAQGGLFGLVERKPAGVDSLTIGNIRLWGETSHAVYGGEAKLPKQRKETEPALRALERFLRQSINEYTKMVRGI